MKKETKDFLITIGLIVFLFTLITSFIIISILTNEIQRENACKELGYEDYIYTAGMDRCKNENKLQGVIMKCDVLVMWTTNCKAEEVIIK